MEINPLSRQIKPEALPLDALATSTHLTEAEKIAGVSRHFEAILLRQFLTEAQKPLLKKTSSMSSATDAIYQDMLVNHLADEISKTGNFGLARSFQAQVLPAQENTAQPGDEKTLR